jgi:hypothetical protein
VEQRLDDLLGREADVQRCVDVHVELWLATPEGRQHPQRDQLAVPRLELRARVDLPETPGDDLIAELRGDIGERVDDSRARVPVDGVEHLLATLETLLTSSDLAHRRSLVVVSVRHVSIPSLPTRVGVGARPRSNRGLHTPPGCDRYT